MAHNKVYAYCENLCMEETMTKGQIEEAITAPVAFKGKVATSSALPASPAANDTYYVENLHYRVTWTGSAWVQSSSDGSEYDDAIDELQEDVEAAIDTMNVKIDGRIKKFYTSNLTAETVSDSDNGTIRNLRIYGRCTQGANPSPSNPQIIHAVTSPTLTITAEGKTPQTATLSGITLNAIPVTSGGNVTIGGQQYIADYVDVEAKQIVRLTKKIVLDGLVNRLTDKYTYQSGKVSYFNHNLMPDGLSTYSTDSITGLCSVIPRSGNYINPNYIRHSGSNKGIEIFNSNDGFMDLYTSGGTVNSVNAKLQTNPIIIIYPLATPTTESLTDAQVADFLALRSYYPATNAVVTSTDISGGSEFLYPCSLDKFVEYVKEELGDTREFVYDLADLADQAFINAQYAEILAELSLE